MLIARRGGGCRKDGAFGVGIQEMPERGIPPARKRDFAPFRFMSIRVSFDGVTASNATPALMQSYSVFPYRISSNPRNPK